MPVFLEVLAIICIVVILFLFVANAIFLTVMIASVIAAMLSNW